MEFKKGDVIEVLNMDDPGWYWGRLDDKFGLVPANYFGSDDAGPSIAFSTSIAAPSVRTCCLHLHVISPNWELVFFPFFVIFGESLGWFRMKRGLKQPGGSWRPRRISSRIWTTS